MNKSIVIILFILISLKFILFGQKNRFELVDCSSTKANVLLIVHFQMGFENDTLWVSYQGKTIAQFPNLLSDLGNDCTRHEFNVVETANQHYLVTSMKDTILLDNFSINNMQIRIFNNISSITLSSIQNNAYFIGVYASNKHIQYFSHSERITCR